MAKTIVGSILHGAYGDLYLQSLCLKHYAVNNPDVELKLFAATKTRLESFRALDLSFASGFELWTEIENHPEIERFYQFQVFDSDLKADVLSNLSVATLAKFDREHNKLPFIYMRDHRLVPLEDRYQLGLSETGRTDLVRVAAANGVADAIWQKPTVGFLWRYRGPEEKAVSGFGQKPPEKLVRTYSRMFRELIERCDCHILICGMNVVTDDTNRERTDCKYPGLRARPSGRPSDLYEGAELAAGVGDCQPRYRLLRPCLGILRGDVAQARWEGGAHGRSAALPGEGRVLSRAVVRPGPPRGDGKGDLQPLRGGLWPAD